MTIIEVGFVIVIPTLIMVVYKSFKQERDALDLDVQQMKGLEEILKKHLGNLPPPSAEPATVVAAAPGDMQNLISEKEAMIKSLSDKISQLEKATQGNPSVDGKEWEKKISDLKDRLAEYEIIEDDIANLTFYKAENLRLKEELSKLGGPTVVTVAPPIAEPPGAPAASSAPEPAPATSAASSIEQVLGVNPTPAAPPFPDNVISISPQPEPPRTNVMAEFEAAVKQKNALETATAKLENKKTSKLAVDEDDEAVSRKAEFPTASPKQEGDIISEFSAAVGDTPPAAAPAEPAGGSGFQATNVNSEKLLDEINQMATEPPPKAAEGEGGGTDDSKKLISEFEAFVKGSGS